MTTDTTAHPALNGTQSDPSPPNPQTTYSGAAIGALGAVFAFLGVALYARHGGDRQEAGVAFAVAVLAFAVALAAGALHGRRNNPAARR